MPGVLSPFVGAHTVRPRLPAGPGGGRTMFAPTSIPRKPGVGAHAVRPCKFLFAFRPFSAKKVPPGNRRFQGYLCFRKTLLRNGAG